ncbi:DUF421 domain-containing protein [Tuberibacillus sp. Marseille-P3662]|uniref:DUF421 domain-containing protein n=1 Tax=Tuberibacillus sp. Marseille-P3662 TaxID=1965358 RepID=UPI000A1C927F|nr:DUF421 domain-containing protein [Tuberibacillus sp. Marseille-P3662]
MPEWINILLRSLFIFVVLFVMTKGLGKKQLTHLTFFEYITGITIGSIAAAISMDIESNLFHGLISMVVWALVPLAFSVWSLKSKSFRDVVEGKGTIFIKDGKILEDNLKKEKFTTDELLTQLRSKNIFKTDDVEFAVLEPTGELDVLLKKENQPLTPKDMDMSVPAIKEPQTVIMDGKIQDEPLSTIGLNRGWLHTALDKQGVALENVFLGQVDSSGQLTVDLYDDKIQVPSPQKKPLLLNTLKKCQADLETFALETKSEPAKEMYTKNAKELEKVLDKVTHLLKQ